MAGAIPGNVVGVVSDGFTGVERDASLTGVAPGALVRTFHIVTAESFCDPPCRGTFRTFERGTPLELHVAPRSLLSYRDRREFPSS